MKEEISVPMYSCDMCGEHIYTGFIKEALKDTVHIYALDEINGMGLDNTHLCRNCFYKLSEVVRFLKKLGADACISLREWTVDPSTGKLISKS